MRILEALRSLVRRDAPDDPDREALEARQRTIEEAIAERRRRLEALERQVEVQRRDV